MKKIYIILAIIGGIGLSNCGKNEKVSQLEKQLRGEWQLVQWSANTPREFDIYLVFNADKTFEIYQQFERLSFQMFSGKFVLSDTLLTGIYSDKTAWGSSYNIEIDASGNTLTTISTSDISEVSVYKRTTIPSSIKEGATVMADTRSIIFKPL